jgi:hypothetical protein
MAATIQTYESVHREVWPDQRVAQIFFESTVFIGLMKKDRAMGYKGKHIALQYGRPTGRSRSLARARANVDSSKFEDFFIRAVDDYATVELEGKLIRSSKNPDAAFIVDVLERETQGAMSQLMQSSALNAAQDGSGVRGRISGAPAETAGPPAFTVVTLADPADSKNFEVGMEIQFAATPLGTLRDGGARYEVIGVDHSAGTVRFPGLLNTTSGVVANDYMFQDGDAADGGTRPMLAGFESWIPATAPAPGDNHFGVDRSIAPVPLAGWRFTAASLGTTTIYQTLFRSAAQMTRLAPKNAVNAAMLNSEDYGTLLNELTVTGTWNQGIERRGNDVNVFYQGVKIQTPIGPVDVMHDPQWRRGRAALIAPDSWTFHTIGEQPGFAEEDGTRFLRTAGDSYEARLVVHPQVSCDAPGWNATIALP